MPSNQDVRVRAYQDGDAPFVIALWQELLADSAPHNDPQRVIRQKIQHDRDLFFVAVVGAAVVGTVMGGYDGHRGWIYALAVARAHQRRGIASLLVARLEAALVQRGCMKINLQVRASNEQVVSFYKKLGYTVEDRISMGKQTYDTDPGA